MYRAALCAAILLLAACQFDQSPSPKFGNATVYTTPGTPGGVSKSSYEVTPL